MLYNRLTTEELERRVYIEPSNAPAAAELLRRVTGLIDQQDDDLVEARDRADQLEKDLTQKEDEVSALDDDLASANSKIQELEETIAELTFSGDLV